MGLGLFKSCVLTLMSVVIFAIVLSTASTQDVLAAPKLTTRADCALTSICRVAVVVNRRSAQPDDQIR